MLNHQLNQRLERGEAQASEQEQFSQAVRAHLREQLTCGRAVRSLCCEFTREEAAELVRGLTALDTLERRDRLQADSTPDTKEQHAT